jgi:hypothetical protein
VPKCEESSRSASGSLPWILHWTFDEPVHACIYM